MKQMWMIAMITAVMVAGEAESGVGSWLGKAGKSAMRVCMRSGRKAVSEGTEVAIRTVCPKLGDDAVKLVAKYGDDMARVLSRHGDEAVRLVVKHGDDVAKLFVKHGDDVMRIAAKYGDDGVRCLAREGDVAVELIRQHGDEVVEVLMTHHGIGGQLVKVCGRESVTIARNVTEDGAVMLIRHGGKLSGAQMKKVAAELAKSGRKMSGKDVLKVILRKAPHIGVGIAVVMCAKSASGAVDAVSEKIAASSAGGVYVGIAGLVGIVAGLWAVKEVAVAWVRCKCGSTERP